MVRIFAIYSDGFLGNMPEPLKISAFETFNKVFDLGASIFVC